MGRAELDFYRSKLDHEPVRIHEGVMDVSCHPSHYACSNEYHAGHVQPAVDVGILCLGRRDDDAQAEPQRDNRSGDINNGNRRSARMEERSIHVAHRHLNRGNVDLASRACTQRQRLRSRVRVPSHSGCRQLYTALTMGDQAAKHERDPECEAPLLFELKTSTVGKNKRYGSLCCAAIPRREPRRPLHRTTTRSGCGALVGFHTKSFRMPSP
jgi:hypothetical protein